MPNIEEIRALYKRASAETPEGSKGFSAIDRDKLKAEMLLNWHAKEHAGILLAEVERLKIDKAVYDSTVKQMAQKMLEVARLTAERDAAVRDITCLDICEVCKHKHNGEACRERKHFAKAVMQADCFEWRGVQQKEAT